MKYIKADGAQTHSEVMMILLVLLLSAAGGGHAYSIKGQEKNGTCVCDVKSSVWAFPAANFDQATELLENCKDSLRKLQTQIAASVKQVPTMEATLQKLKNRMENFKYLNDKGLYKPLKLKEISREVQQLHDTVSAQPGGEAQRIRSELKIFKDKLDQMYTKKVFNLEAMKDKLRILHNRVQACKTIPQDFRSSCYQRIMSNISAPLVTKMNPLSTSYVAGAWGHDSELDESYWIQVLDKDNKLGYYVRFYKTFEDFMASRNHKDEYVVNSYTDANTIQGPGTIVYKGVVYYQCYYKPDICAYNVKTKEFRRLTIPDAGFNNKFPFCYYSCFDWTDFSLSVDDNGLWVIYATEANHGNLVVSRVNTEGLNITHTWKTRLFKRSVTNTFMVCGVLYATRFVNTYREEVFYAFDTTTGLEDNTLSIPMEKVAAGVANLHYNRKDMKLYMYSGGYMLAYQAYF